MTENLPTEITRKEIRQWIKEHRKQKEEKIHLEKNKYDITYCINMLRQIQDYISLHKFGTNADLVLSLSYTLKRMIAHLEIERDNP
jgi:adenosyl cobinamide kinase/adenosyl cobinamide phosphate guanylyltransferase